MEIEYPDIFSQIQNIKKLGEGKSSEVYLMSNSSGQQLYGLKQFKCDSNDDYQREIEVLHDLKHDSIIKLVSHKPSQILLEYCSNGNMFQYLNQSQSWPDELIRYYMKQLIQGIKYAHQHQYAHMDIKLQNILLDEKFNLKLADWSFGQKFLRGQQFKQIRGTKQYMAPEITGDKKYYANCADIFSLGVVLFLMKFQVLPFYQSSQKDDLIYKNIVQKNYSKFWNFFAEHYKKCESKEFKDLIQGILSFNPEERFTIQEIEQSNYLNDKTMTSEEVYNFMSAIKQNINFE